MKTKIRSGVRPSDRALELKKREIFAAMAMNGILSALADTDALPMPDILARSSILAADALIAELSKPPFTEEDEKL